MRVSFSMTATLRMPREDVLDERDIRGSRDTGGMPTASSEEYWRSRAGVPAVKGVLAPQAGSPGVAPLPAVADAQVEGDAPVRLARLPVGPAVAELVRHVWIPRWQLPPGMAVEQGVLEYPSANLVVEPESAALY